MRRNLDALADMVRAAKDAIELVEGLSLHEFERTSTLQWAVANRLSVVGEAVTRTTDEFRQLYREVPWQQAKRLRNVIVHEYDHIDTHIVWDTVRNSLPALIEQLVAILDENE